MSSPLRWAEGRALIGGVRVEEIAADFGTPVFVYDGEQVRAQYRALEELLEYRPLGIYYSVKANSAVGILRVLRELGAGADVCSPGDVLFAEAAGFPQHALSFTGTGLGAAEYDLVERRPELDFVADSVAQVARITELAPGRPIGLRLNPAIEAGFHPHVRAGSAMSRFGIRRHQLPAALELAAAAGTPIVGLHGHLGSDILEVEPFLRLAEQLRSVAVEIPSVRWINLGGGLGVASDDGADRRLLRVLSAALVELFAGQDELELRVEPGGYLTMGAGLLVAQVTEVRDATVCVDASSNHLVSAVIYDTHHPVWRVSGAGTTAVGTYDVAGNLMQAGDVLARDRRLPEVRAGDLLGFGRCGAYSSSRSTTFNNRGRPAEVLVLDGKARLLRRREEPAELLRFEATQPYPEWSASTRADTAATTAQPNGVKARPPSAARV